MTSGVPKRTSMRHHMPYSLILEEVLQSSKPPSENEFISYWGTALLLAKGYSFKSSTFHSLQGNVIFSTLVYHFQL